MSDISQVGLSGARRVDVPLYETAARRADEVTETARPRRGADEVEVSDMALYLSKLRSLPEVRSDLVDRVRRDIAEGRYDAPEFLDKAMDAMIDDARR
jgi:anti-sigma28 factor (negative regulator of flagellin synthesis)